MQPLVTSILGAPASGKPYFLAAMTWQLRQSLGAYFSIAFGDADSAANRSECKGYEGARRRVATSAFFVVQCKLREEPE